MHPSLRTPVHPSRNPIDTRTAWGQLLHLGLDCLWGHGQGAAWELHGICMAWEAGATGQGCRTLDAGVARRHGDEVEPAAHQDTRKVLSMLPGPASPCTNAALDHVHNSVPAHLRIPKQWHSL